eukprot:scaffold23635_cov42-Prasinocladus_malaysianus.AAC.1
MEAFSLYSSGQADNIGKSVGITAHGEGNTVGTRAVTSRNRTTFDTSSFNNTEIVQEDGDTVTV